MKSHMQDSNTSFPREEGKGVPEIHQEAVHCQNEKVLMRRVDLQYKIMFINIINKVPTNMCF
jgi:hypothetical protein